MQNKSGVFTPLYFIMRLVLLLAINVKEYATINIKNSLS